MQKPYADRLRKIGALLLDLQDDAARLRAQKTLAKCEAKDLQSLAEVFRGVLCYIDYDHPGTIAHLTAAFEDPELAPPGDLWHMLGVASREEGDYGRAPATSFLPAPAAVIDSAFGGIR